MSHLPRRRHEPALAKTRGPMIVKTRCDRCGGVGMVEEPDRIDGWYRCSTCNGVGEIVVGTVRKGAATITAREQVRDTHQKFGRQPYD